MSLSTKNRRLLGAVVCAIVAFCALPGFTTTGQAADAVTYIDKTWDEETNTVKEETKECTAYTLIDEKVGKDYDLTDDVKDGWYVLDRDVKRLTDAAISISGNVNLILEDNSKLYTGWADNDNYRIILEPNSTLTVYGQRKGTGEIIVDAPYGAAGIRVPSSATLNIKGGTIDAEGTTGGAGIGGNKKESAGTINILGGTVKAEGGNNAAGIGGGYKGAGGIITINGGTIVAEGSNGAANIGGGKKGSTGTINITGGNIKGYSNHNITLDGVNEEVEVVGINCDYGINDVHTLDNGKLYFNISDDKYANLTEIIVEDKEGNRSTYKKQGDTDIFSRHQIKQSFTDVVE